MNGMATCIIITDITSIVKTVFFRAVSASAYSDADNVSTDQPQPKWEDYTLLAKQSFPGGKTHGKTLRVV